MFIRFFSFAFDVVHVFHVRFDEFEPGFDVALAEFLLFDGAPEIFAKPLVHRFAQKPRDGFDAAVFQRFVGSGDRRAEIRAGGFEPGVGETFARPVDAHQRFNISHE